MQYSIFTDVGYAIDFMLTDTLRTEDTVVLVEEAAETANATLKTVLEARGKREHDGITAREIVTADYAPLATYIAKLRLLSLPGMVADIAKGGYTVIQRLDVDSVEEKSGK